MVDNHHAVMVAALAPEPSSPAGSHDRDPMSPAQLQTSGARGIICCTGHIVERELERERYCMGPSTQAGPASAGGGPSFSLDRLDPRQDLASCAVVATVKYRNPRCGCLANPTLAEDVQATRPVSWHLTSADALSKTGSWWLLRGVSGCSGPWKMMPMSLQYRPTTERTLPAR